MKFYFFRNEERYRGDFFSINTVLHNLSAGGIRVGFRSIFVGPIIYTTFERTWICMRWRLMGSAEWICSKSVSSERAHQVASKTVFKSLCKWNFMWKLFSMLLYYSHQGEKYWSASVILDSPMISTQITLLHSNQVSYLNRDQQTRWIDP